MLFFHHNVSQNPKGSEMSEMVRIQTDKCYRHIPKYYFEREINGEVFNSLLTRDKAKMLGLRERLTDYADEVPLGSCR